jgi:hypothetical protein
MVPRPGRWRTGIHSASTATEMTTVTWPSVRRVLVDAAVESTFAPGRGGSTARPRCRCCARDLALRGAQRR